MENTFDRIVDLRAQCDLDESVSITMDTTFKDIDLDPPGRGQESPWSARTSSASPST